MPTETPAMSIACPRCTAQPGEHCASKGKLIATHSARLQKHRAEASGPVRDDVVYIDQKYRVLEVEMGTVLLRRGSSRRVVMAVERADLSYDAFAGMWRTS